MLPERPLRYQSKWRKMADVLLSDNNSEGQSGGTTRLSHQADGAGQKK
jgi:hypothetical protein